jgi:hypothetical protein
MVLATGTDSARLMVKTPANFHASPFENFPGLKRRYGHTQYGNVITAEVLNELYWCFKVLVATKWSTTWNGNGEQNIKSSSGDTPSSPGTYDDNCNPTGEQDGKQKAVAAWGTTASGDTAPYAMAHAKYSRRTDPPHPCGGSSSPSQASPVDGCSGYSLCRAYSYGTISGLCTRQANAVAFYAYAESASGCGVGATNVTCTGVTASTTVTFDSEGDAVGYQVWKSYGSLGAGVRSSGSARLGSIAMPTLIGFPDGVNCFDSYDGYAVIDQCAVVRGDVEGGFTVIDPPPTPPNWFWWWMQGA